MYLSFYLISLTFLLIIIIQTARGTTNHYHESIFNPSTYVDIPNRPRPWLKTIFWMHIQKTSSWLGNFLLVWSCPSFCIYDLQRRNITQAKLNDSATVVHHLDYLVHVDEYFHKHNVTRVQIQRRASIMNCSVNFESYYAGFGFHRPYNQPDRMNHTIVTLFRNPSSRVISAYLFDIMFPLGSRSYNGTSIEQMKKNIRRANNSILAYALSPGIASCQTKMMIGYNCGEDVPLNANDLDEAKRRLHDLYFFGLTEESEASANLFLAMHFQDGGLPYRRSLEELSYPPFKFTTTRKNRKHSKDAHADLTRQLNESGWKDVHDEILFAEATKIFYERCQLYSIKTLFNSPDSLKTQLNL
jgi:hypothetical protein